MKVVLVIFLGLISFVHAQFGFGGFPGGRINAQIPGLGGLNGQIPGLGGLNGQIPGLGGLNARIPGIGGINAQIPGLGGVNVQIPRIDGVQELVGSAINAAINCKCFKFSVVIILYQTSSNSVIPLNTQELGLLLNYAVSYSQHYRPK